MNYSEVKEELISLCDREGKGKGRVGLKHRWREAVPECALSHFITLAYVLAQLFQLLHLAEAMPPRRSEATCLYSFYQEKLLLS